MKSAWSALWTFPSILISAFVIAWGAEAAQFLISQGLALAILAWLQTLPEFAVEAVIAWQAGKDLSKTHLVIANFTGSLRLLVGLGWPMIYFVAAAFGWKDAHGFVKLELEDEHYQVTIWVDGSSAYPMIQRTHPALLIVDLHMQQPEAATALIRFLASPEAAPAIAKAGLLPPAPR